MPKSCCVPCCTNNTRKNNGVKFFCVPKDGKRRMKWFQSIRREDGPGKLWAPASKHIYVCSIHFVTGIKSNDPLNPDYTPTLFPHLSERERQRAVYRQKKFETNRQLNRKRAAALAGGVSPKKDKSGLKLHTASPSFIDRCGWSEVEHDYCISRVKRSNTPASSPDPEASGRPEPSGLPAQATENRTERASPKPCANESCQTALKKANDECRALRAELSELRDRTKRTAFYKEAFEEDEEEEEEEEEEKVRELTGLPSRAELMSVFTALTPGGTFQNFILTLMHLKLNLPFQFFMHVLLISKSAALLMFSKTLDLLHDGLSAFIRWPSKEPTSGDHSEYSKNRTATVAIDCFEILVETQTHPRRNRVSSVKYLIATTTEGVVTFVSTGWPGETVTATDTEIAERCGLVEKLSAGDVVIAGHKFDLGDSVGRRGAAVRRPAKGPTPAESAIRRLRDTYALLRGPVRHSVPEELARLDKAVRICCVLHNIGESRVHREVASLLPRFDAFPP